MNGDERTVTLTKRQVIIIIILVLLLIVGGVILGMNWSRLTGSKNSGSAAENSTAGGVELDPDARVYTGTPPTDGAGGGNGIKIPGYPSITIEKDTPDVTMALLDPQGNPCYFKFEIVLTESGETVYESGYVSPGDCIYDVHLTRAIAQGDYPAVIRITTLSLDGETPMNGADVETTLVVR
ncbi:MAG: hypothetical protein IJ806_11960 [Ruminococcus sp.]|nr:hypothetical protein [Ruminococcus sp.]